MSEELSEEFFYSKILYLNWEINNFNYLENEYKENQMKSWTSKGMCQGKCTAIKW